MRLPHQLHSAALEKARIPLRGPHFQLIYSDAEHGFISLEAGGSESGDGQAAGWGGSPHLLARRPAVSSATSSAPRSLHFLPKRGTGVTTFASWAKIVKTNEIMSLEVCELLGECR